MILYRTEVVRDNPTFVCDSWTKMNANGWTDRAQTEREFLLCYVVLKICIKTSFMIWIKYIDCIQDTVSSAIQYINIMLTPFVFISGKRLSVTTK